MLSGERTRLQVFEMRSKASGAAFHRACTHATQEAFLEAHQSAFRYFGGFFWDYYELIANDEVGYVPMADLGAEFLFLRKEQP